MVDVMAGLGFALVERRRWFHLHCQRPKSLELDRAVRKCVQHYRRQKPLCKVRVSEAILLVSATSEAGELRYLFSSETSALESLGQDGGSLLVGRTIEIEDRRRTASYGGIKSSEPIRAHHDQHRQLVVSKRVNPTNKGIHSRTILVVHLSEFP